jgi:hypothetical protein
VLRCSGGIPSVVDTDGRGLDESSAKEIWQSYRDNGCIVAQHGGAIEQSTDVINQNGIFDTARRFSKCVRSIRREQFIGYEVTGGKSILYFKPDAYGLSIIDQFAGISPSRVAITTGSIIAGRSYIVRSGTVTYNGSNIVAGGTFAGVSGVADFQGSGLVYEANGIRHTADLAGWTNEWLLDFNFQIYRPRDETSIFKEQAYADYFTVNDRCIAGSYNAAADVSMRSHLRMAGLLTPFPAEGNTVLRYAPTQSSTGGPQINSNICGGGDVACQAFEADFYSSCRLYEPPVEVDKAEIIIESGSETLKLTMTGRLHHCPTAAASYARNTWTTATIAAQPYRTAENALQEYLDHYTKGSDCANSSFNAGMAGNVSLGYDLTTAGPVSGACYPNFQFTQLIRIPYDDGNDVQNVGVDSVMDSFDFQQSELYLRFMSEGYIDGLATQNGICDGGSAVNFYDFTYEALCTQATGRPWLRAFSASDRPDAPQGFGPYPNTVARAGVHYNELAAAWNLLTDARIPLPLKVQARITDAAQNKSKPADWPVGSVCSTTYDSSVRAIKKIPLNTSDDVYDVPGAWFDVGDSGASVTVLPATAGFDIGASACSGSDWRFIKSCYKIELRMQLSGTSSDNALPETIADLAVQNAAGFLGSVLIHTDELKRRQVSLLADAEGCTTAKLYDGLTLSATHLTRRP